MCGFAPSPLARTTDYTSARWRCRHSLSLKQQQHALAMIDEGKSQSEVAEIFGVHRSTICRLVSERRLLEHR